MSNEVEIVITGQDKTDSAWTSVKAKAAAAGKAVSDAFKRSSNDGMGRAGEEGGDKFGASLIGRIGPIIARAPISPHLIAGAAAAAPAVSSMLAAAISGGAALGAVGIGAAIVAQRDDVQKAAGDMGESIFRSLKADATPMVTPILAAIDTIENRADRMRPSIRNIFEDAAGFVPILTNAVADSANEIVGSFEKVVDGAGPAIDVIGNHLPKVAAAAGDALEMMGEGGARSAAMLATAMTAVEGTLRLTAGTMSILNKATPFLFGHLMLLNDALDGSGDAAEDSTFNLDEFLKGLGDTGTAATKTEQKIRSLDEMLNDFADEATNAFNAETKFGEALDDIRDKANRNSAGLNANTKRGQENRNALAALAQQTRASAAATAAMAGGQNRANGIMNTGRTAFINAARAMGISKTAAEKLADSFGLLKSKSITITTTYVTRRITRDGEHVSGGSTGTGGTQVKGYASGGILGAAGGGPRSNDVWVGEGGPEIVSLPFGSTVHTAGDSARRMLSGRSSGWAGTSGGDVGTELLVRAVPGADGDLMRALLSALRYEVNHGQGRGSVRRLLQSDLSIP